MKVQQFEKELYNDHDKIFYFIMQVADHLPDMLLVSDLDKQQIVFTNNKLLELFAYDERYILEKGTDVFRDKIYSEDYQKYLIHLNECRSLTVNESSKIDLRLLSGEGQFRWFSFIHLPLAWNEAGAVTELIHIGTDIHEAKLKSYPNGFEKPDEFVNGNNFSETILKTIAMTNVKSFAEVIRDIRNPLTAISLSTEMLEHHLASSDTHETAESFVHIIKRNTQEIESQLKSILKDEDADRLDDLDICDLAELVDETLVLSAGEISSSRVRINRSYGMGYFVSANREKLKNVLAGILIKRLKTMSSDETHMHVMICEKQQDIIVILKDNVAEEDSEEKYFIDIITGEKEYEKNTDHGIEESSARLARVEINTDMDMGTTIMIYFRK